MSIGMIAKPPFAVLKSINDNSRDLEEMIKKVKNFENVLDEVIDKNTYKTLGHTDKTPLFTAETVAAMKKAKAVQDAIKGANVAYANMPNERHIEDDGEER